MAATQKAVAVVEVGKPVVNISDRPIPQPLSQQLLVKVKVVGLNGHDQKMRDMGLFIARGPPATMVGLPAVLGQDVVGEVVQLGADVTNFAVGDRVVTQAAFAPGTAQNGLQEYAIFDVVFTAKIPALMSDDDAATLPTNVMSAFCGLFHNLEIPTPWSARAASFDAKGTTILIIGGGSVGGRFAVQLARIAGIGKIVVVGGKEEDMKTSGATHVLNRYSTTLPEDIRAAVGDSLLYAFDAVSPPESQHLAVNALSDHARGKLARLLPMGPVDASKVQEKPLGYSVLDVLGVSHVFPELCGEFWAHVPAYLEQGLLQPLARDAYTVKTGLEAKTVNEILDSFVDGKILRHTHVHVQG